MFLTTRGLILREARYKESDKILTILTEAEGKLSAKARGVARPKSKLSAPTQLLSFSELTLFGNKGRWTINEASTVEQFRGLRMDIDLLALGSYIAELLESVSDEDYPNAEILQLGLNSLYALSSGLASQALVKAAFELRLMCLSGYQPELSVCAACGKAELDEAYLIPAHGELYCANCQKYSGLPLDAATLEAMRYIISAEPKRLFSFSLEDESMRRLSTVCEAYTLYQLDRPFGSLDYYKRVSKR